MRTQIGFYSLLLVLLININMQKAFADISCIKTVSNLVLTESANSSDQSSFIDDFLDNQELMKIYDEIDDLMALARKDKGNIDQIIIANDKLMPETAKILAEHGIPAHVEYKSIMRDGNKMKFSQIVIDPLPAHGSLQSINVLEKIRTGLGVQQMRIDLVHTFLRGANALYSSRIVTIDLHSFMRSLVDEVTNSSLIHEFSHGQFAKMRRNKIKSIFSSDYHGYKKFDLGGSSYKNYMSVEELYNYMNQPYWSFREYADLEKFGLDEVIYQLKRVERNLDTSIDIALKTKQLALDFSNAISQINDLSYALTQFQTVSWNIATNSEKEEVIRIWDKNNRRLQSFVDSDKEQDVYEFQQLQKDFKEWTAKFYPTFDSNNSLSYIGLIFRGIPKKQRAEFKQFQKKFTELQKRILESVLDEQKELIRLTDNIVQAKDIVASDIVEIKAYLNTFNEDTAMAHIDEIQQELKRVRQTLKGYGNLVKERYSGYGAVLN